jgi:hypothetical protein
MEIDMTLPVHGGALAACVLAILAGPAPAQQTWTEQTTAAAMGYCLARHPYIPRDPANPYTTEGFEILSSPGVLGAVRRNYVFQRGPVSVTDPDKGQGQDCKQACMQFGLNYGANLGRPLNYRDPAGNTVADGIGDMASLGYRDFDWYNNQSVIAGMWGRPLNYHESDVAQADFCCCQLDPASQPQPTRACVQFEQPLIVGTRFGPAQGHNPGDVIFTENGITVTLEKFQQVNGGTGFNEAYVDGVLVPGGATQSLRTNNIAVRFDFSGLAYQAQGASFRYLDFGGSEHLSANGDPALADDIPAMNGATTGGATVTVTSGPSGISSTPGAVTLTGPIKVFDVGGQEFWIDEVCAEP